MKLFNIDLHISVIADIKKIFENLGYNIIDKCLSGHANVLGRKQDQIFPLNNDWRLLDKNICNYFYERFKDELKEYDGFICTYPPSFSLLYEKFNKPIILQVPIRFEVPFENDSNKLKWFVDYLKSGIDNKQIIPICNSLYDKKYCELYTDREWKLIPNICEYTGISYSGKGIDYLLYSNTPINCNHNNVKTKEEYLGFNYKWDKLNDVKGIIHLPYNTSTMSIFEQYTGNIPLLFPTPEFNIELFKKGITLSQISWTVAKYEWVEKNIKTADYYNEEWMPYINYFSSFKELKNMIECKNDHIDNSNKMKEFNKTRKEKIYNLWSKTLNETFNSR